MELRGQIKRVQSLSGKLCNFGGKGDHYTTKYQSALIPTVMTTVAKSVQYINYDGLYTITDYILFDGNSYIDTKFKPTNNTKIVVKCKFNVVNKYLFGSRTSATSDDAHAFLPAQKSTYAQFGSNQKAAASVTQAGEIITVTQSQSGTYVNDSLVKSYADMNFTSAYDLFVGACNNGGTADSRMLVGDIYSFGIYENGTEIKHLLPCVRDSDNKLGMIDIIGGTFYTATVAETNTTNDIVSEEATI